MLRVPAELGGGSIKLELAWESGDTEHHWFWLREMQTIESVEGFLAKRLPLPKQLRLGYHRAKIYWVREPELEEFGEARLIVCPSRTAALDHRVAGVALSLYGLRSKRNWGIGDFTDLRAVVEAFAPAGGGLYRAESFCMRFRIGSRSTSSPYLPQCALYRNFIYLDVEKGVGETRIDESEVQEALRSGPHWSNMSRWRD